MLLNTKSKSSLGESLANELYFAWWSSLNPYCPGFSIAKREAIIKIEPERAK